MLCSFTKNVRVLSSLTFLVSSINKFSVYCSDFSAFVNAMLYTVSQRLKCFYSLAIFKEIVIPCKEGKLEYSGFSIQNIVLFYNSNFIKNLISILLSRSFHSSFTALFLTKKTSATKWQNTLASIINFFLADIVLFFRPLPQSIVLIKESADSQIDPKSMIHKF